AMGAFTRPGTPRNLDRILSRLDLDRLPAAQSAADQGGFGKYRQDPRIASRRGPAGGATDDRAADGTTAGRYAAAEFTGSVGFTPSAQISRRRRSRRRGRCGWDRLRGRG